MSRLQVGDLCGLTQGQQVREGEVETVHRGENLVLLQSFSRAAPDIKENNSGPPSVFYFIMYHSLVECLALIGCGVTL